MRQGFVKSNFDRDLRWITIRQLPQLIFEVRVTGAKKRQLNIVPKQAIR